LIESKLEIKFKFYFEKSFKECLCLILRKMFSYLRSSYADYAEQEKKRVTEEKNSKLDSEMRRIQDMEDPMDGTVPIDFKMREVNYHNIRRKRAFTLGSKITIK